MTANIINLFDRSKSSALPFTGLNRPQSETLRACSAWMEEAKSILDTLIYNDPGLKRFFATRDDYGWGTRYLNNMSHGADRYGGDWNDISMCWAAYLAQQCLRRLEREVGYILMAGQEGIEPRAPRPEFFTLPQEDALYCNATACPRDSARIMRILDLTVRAIEKLTAFPAGPAPVAAPAAPYLT